MATLVLTVAGSIIGGPIGAAIGAAIGQQVDQRLFAPKGRTGPRLGDLAVQTSTYGTPLPKLFGKVRVAGSVIWATDLVESRRKVSSGKGQPKSTVFSYSANVAIALSARPIGSVGRIWADGKLLRGAAGDFKTPCQFRLYTGGPDQAVDPLISAMEGLEQTPAYTGLAYAVFEDLALEDYGNRIPSLSFEVIAEDGPVALGDIAVELAGDGLSAGPTPLIDGMAVTGESVLAVLATLREAMPFRIHPQAGNLHLTTTGTDSGSLTRNDLVVRTGEEATRWQSVRKAGDVPAMLALRYNDPDRDYQPGLQRSLRATGARREARIDLAATLTADRARGTVQALHTALAAGSDEVRVSLPWRWLGLSLGSTLTLPGSAYRWQLVSLTFEGMALDARFRQEALADTIAPTGTAGRGVAEADRLHGPTRLVLMDLPPLSDTPATAPMVAVAAAGPQEGWRRAALLMSRDGGAHWEDAGETAAPALIGTCLSVLGAAGPHLEDRRNDLVVQLLNAGMDLSDADAAAMADGANSAMIGAEMIQFARAEPLGNGHYRLSGLWRGRRGTEWAVALHGPGEDFVLLDQDALRLLDIPNGTTALTVSATGLGDGDDGVLASIPATGQATRPLSPCHINMEAESGGVRLRWTRRSRNGWRWDDAVDAPLGEEQERYGIAIIPDTGVPRYAESNEPAWLYDADQRAEDLAAGVTQLQVQIFQIGTFGRSASANSTISIA